MRSKRIFGILIVLVFGGGTFLTTAWTQESRDYDESFDPLQLKEPETMLFHEESQHEVARKIASDTASIAISEEETEEQRTGYRVQLVLTPNYQEVDSLYSKVQQMFEGEAQPYLVYDSPNYKIQIGDYKSRGEAEKFKELAQKRGFRFSWVVPSTIASDTRE